MVHGGHFREVILDFLEIPKLERARVLILNYFKSSRSRWCNREPRLISRLRAFLKNGLVMRGRIFQNVEILGKVEDSGRCRALNRSGVLAGANFIALWRRASYIT